MLKPYGPELPVQGEQGMNDGFLGLADAILMISVLGFNFFFLSMFRILRGKWYRFSPTWRWLQDVRALRRLSLTAESDELRQECRLVLHGIYISSGLLALGILLAGIT
jgi:hypothetical protein